MFLTSRCHAKSRGHVLLRLVSDCEAYALNTVRRTLLDQLSNFRKLRVAIGSNTDLGASNLFSS
jgi:hypothetical protein